MNSNEPTRRTPSITARPAPDEKQRFAELATSRGISESALALIAIRALLESNGSSARVVVPGTGRRAATDGITIRLRSGDGRALNERAVRRGMKASTYLAALIRAHIAASPLLTADELMALKQAVVALAALGRVLAQIARHAAQGGGLSPDLQQELRRVPEVMVKVIGGGMKIGAVAAHLAYISRKRQLEIETDEGTHVGGKDEQKALLKDWHLELSAGQYRGPRDGRTAARSVKLVHNIVLSMPAPTPPDKVLAAARKFAQEKFALQHRYAMVLHTDQQHPHVRMVVRAESEQGRRLHIDKEMLREWREDFARMMREQGTAANATSRVARGRKKGKTRDAIYRAQRRGASTAVRDRVTVIAKQLVQTGSFGDPARGRLLETRKLVVAHWMKIADILDLQGEVFFWRAMSVISHAICRRS